LLSVARLKQQKKQFHGSATSGARKFYALRREELHQAVVRAPIDHPRLHTDVPQCGDWEDLANFSGAPEINGMIDAKRLTS